MYLTKRQKEVVDYLREYSVRHGYAPTFDEIAHRFGFSSKGTVYKHIRALQDKGVIKHDWNRTRSLELIPQPPEGNTLALLGRVSAGKPIEAVQDNQRLEIPPMLLRSGSHFVLKVSGNSMVDEQIQDGDLVVIQERQEAENGETVVALVDGTEATIKRFYRRNGRVELRAANEDVKPLVVDGDRVRIQGIVVGIVRSYRRVT